MSDQIHIKDLLLRTIIGINDAERRNRQDVLINITFFADLRPQGVAVVAEGLHMCAAMRGVEKANARMSTSAMLGSFKTSQATRNEFLSHIGRRSVNF